MPRSLLRRQQSVLLLVDIQERLLPALKGGERLVEQAAWLLGVARRLGVPVLASEQYPQGLGPTVASLRDRLKTFEVVTKTRFSAVGLPLLEAPAGDREQWVVAGCETHVCVLQTVLELLQRGRRVYVVDEAVASRRSSDRELALQRMVNAGALRVSREMVAFEWLEDAADPDFRDLHRDFLR